MLDLDLTNKILDSIEQTPDSLNMAVWGRKSSCGTVMCLAGHVVVHEGYRIFWPEPDEDGDRIASSCYRPEDEPTVRAYAEQFNTSPWPWNVDRPDALEDIEAMATRLLGVDPFDARFLFAMHNPNSVSFLRRLARLLADCERNDTSLSETGRMVNELLDAYYAAVRGDASVAEQMAAWEPGPAPTA